MWVALLVAPSAEAQLRTPAYRVEMLGAGASAYPLPYGLTANRYGRIDAFGGSALLSLGAHIGYTEGRRLDYALGIETLGRLGDTSTLHVHQGYARARYAAFELSAGRWEQTLGVVDPTLSAGSMVWSANTSPLPRITLGIPRFTAIPGTRDFAFIRGHVSHGWFERERFVAGAQLHEKSFYLRLFSEKAPIQLHGGVAHSVIWGGTHPGLGRLPSSFSDYLRVFFIQEGTEEAPQFEVINVLGNTIGTYDFSVTVRALGIDWLAYRHFYIEAGPGLRFRSPWDGMWGLSLKTEDRRGLVAGVLYEHVNTKRQGAQYSRGEANGPDNYYNNILYRGGWVYHGRTIGLPLLVADGRRRGIVNNILLAHHLGIEGNLGAAAYRALVTYSRNYGAIQVFESPESTLWVNGRTERRDQYSMLVEVSGPLAPAYALSYRAAVAWDTGALYTNTVGAMVGVVWAPATR